MADFQEVIKQWKCRCEHCDNNENVECSINGYVCNGFHEMKNYMNAEFIERDVMRWAAEHPEPVYPTWFEWLKSVGALPAEQTICHRGLEQPIPADIAEKLGIKQKDGCIKKGENRNENHA